MSLYSRACALTSLLLTAGLLHVCNQAGTPAPAPASATRSTITFSVPLGFAEPTQPMSAFADAVRAVLEEGIGKAKPPGLSFGAYGMGGKINVGVSVGKVSANAFARDLKPDDRFAYGSGTKMFTMAGVMQLVAAGKIGLDDAAYTHIDPLLQRTNGTTLGALFGEKSFIKDVTVRHLLSMQSGLQDVNLGKQAFNYDVAFQNGYDLSPLDLLHSCNKTFMFQPGTFPYAAYSSTNFLLLGLLLASKSGASSWDTYNYREVMGPPEVRATMPNITFPVHGHLSKYTDVDGYMCEVIAEATQHKCNIIDVAEKNAMQGSFGFGHMIAAPADVAKFAYNLYGPTKGPFADLKTAEQLRSQILTFRNEVLGILEPYGLGTTYFGDILLTGIQAGFPTTIAYGHIGKAYGMVTHTAYLPSMQTGFSWAVNKDGGLRANEMMLIILGCETIKALLRVVGHPGWAWMCKGVPWNSTTTHGVLSRKRQMRKQIDMVGPAETVPEIVI